MTNHPSSAPSRSHSHSLFNSVSFGEDIDLAVGLTSAAFSFHELYHATKDRRHRRHHLLKAGLASAVSAGAFALMYKEHREDRRPDRPRTRSRNPSRGRHLDDERFHSPPLRSRSSPDIEQDINSCNESKLPHSESVETQRGYFSDDESELLSDGRHRRLPRMPFNYRHSTEKKAIVRSWSRRRPGRNADSHNNSSDDSEARRQRERDARYHRSPSPSPPRHRNTDLG